MVRAFTVFLILMASLAMDSSHAWAAKRVALVIGNSAYEHATPLANPKNDADAVAAVLTRLDFEVLKGTDLTHRQFGRTVASFRKKLAGADVALLFYAGHGLQVHGQNYLAPVDAQLEDEDSLEFEAVRLRAILTLMEREPRTNLVFLDACRDNPMARNLARNLGTRSWSVGRGFAREESGIGTMIAFATQPGNVALDGDEKHSPFTHALLKHIETPGQDIANLMRHVRLDVIRATSSRQVPWNNSSLTAPFIFNSKAEADEANLQTQRSRIIAEREELRRLQAEFMLQKKQWSQAEAERKKRHGELPGKRTDSDTVQLASKTPDRQPASEAEPAPLHDPEELASVLQKELKRVGCYSGKIDGKWGAQSRRALASFVRVARVGLKTQVPTLEAVSILQSRKTPACKPSSATAGTKKPVKQTSKKQPARAAAKPKPTRKKVRYCEYKQDNVGYFPGENSTDC